MREIGTSKIDSHIKRPRTCKLVDRLQKKAITQSHIREIAVKKTAYDEGHLYLKVSILISLGISQTTITNSYLH